MARERAGLEQWETGGLPATWAALVDVLPLSRRTCVVDVGANPNVSAPPYLALLRAGQCDVVGFEPQQASFDDLMSAKSEHETYFPVAVGDGSARDLFVYRSHGFASLYPPYAPSVSVMAMQDWTEIVEKVPFQTVRLDDLAGFPPFDLLKIDIQGGEADVFRGAERVLAGAVAVIVELRYSRLYRDEPMMAGVDVELAQQGFTLHKFLETKSRALRNSQLGRLRKRKMLDQVLDGDAVYLRDPAGIAGWSVDQVAQLAVLASQVFASHSVALFCLDELVRRKAVPADAPARYADALPADYHKAASHTAEHPND